MYWAPWWPSSPGWNMNRTLPARSAWRDESSFAAVTSMVVCRSWPHACMVSSCCDAKSSPVSSCIGSASMSPRRMMVGPGRAPSRVATTLVVESPVVTVSGRPSRASSTRSCVKGRSSPSSGCSCRVRRRADGFGLQVLGFGEQGVGGHGAWYARAPDGGLPVPAGADRDLRPGILDPPA